MEKFLMLAITPFLLITTSCKPRSSAEEGLSNDPENFQTGKVVITREQFALAQMQTGEPAPAEFEQKIRSRGYIGTSPSGRVRISPTVTGRIGRINTSPGTRVRKGEELFILEGPEIISLQQDYAAAFQELRLLKSTYERQKILAGKDISSQKNLEKAESDYLSMLASSEGLKAKLRLLQIDPSRVESGSLTSATAIRSPLNGYVTRQDLIRGQTLGAHETAMEIVDPQQFRLHLHLFESDLKDLAEGQDVQFYTPDDPSRLFKARLTHLGKSIDPETKTILCIADIDPDDGSEFVQNLFVEAAIITCHREVLAIPEEALIREDEKYYVLKLIDQSGENLVFEKTMVRIGTIQEGQAEILDEGMQKLLLKGVYDLSSAE